MEFTIEERDRINLLYGTDFKDITPDDAALIARWEQYKATEDAKANAEIAALNSVAAQKKEDSKRVADAAMAAMEETKNAMLARLARFDDVQVMGNGQA